MFTPSNFEALNSLWDGRAKNVSAVCGTCGVCCPNCEKALLPGEHDYLRLASGGKVDNPSFNYEDCACYRLGVKPVICKTFPLMIDVDITGYHVSFDGQEFSDHYSNNCHKLDFDPEKVYPFLDYLFSDFQNRLWWFWNYGLENGLVDFAKEQFKPHGFKYSKAELSEIMLAIAFKFPDNENHYVKYVYCEDRPNGRKVNY